MPDVQPGSNEVLPTTDKPGYEVEKPSVPMVNPQPELPSAGVDIYNEIDQINKKALCHIEGEQSMKNWMGRLKRSKRRKQYF